MLRPITTLLTKSSKLKLKHTLRSDLNRSHLELPAAILGFFALPTTAGRELLARRYSASSAVHAPRAREEAAASISRAGVRIELVPDLHLPVTKSRVELELRF